MVGGKALQDAVMKAAFGGEDVATDAKEKSKVNGQKAVGKGGVPVPSGRPKGVRNKLTNLRDAVLEAFDEVGGVKYLVKLAEGTQSDRAAFVSLMNKVLPSQINTNVEGGIKLELSWLGTRQIGATTAQPVEHVTQVVDLEVDSKGKYRIADQQHTNIAGGVQGIKPAGGDEDVSR